MATSRTENKSVSGSQRQPSRLQRRAPASININPQREWNIAIPLLSPLTSPVDRSIEMKLREQDQLQQQKKQKNISNSSSQGKQDCEKPPVFKKWQHPASPFGYDSNSTQFRSCIRF